MPQSGKIVYLYLQGTSESSLKNRSHALLISCFPYRKASYDHTYTFDKLENWMI